MDFQATEMNLGGDDGKKSAPSSLPSVRSTETSEKERCSHGSSWGCGDCADGNSGEVITEQMEVTLRGRNQVEPSGSAVSSNKTHDNCKQEKQQEIDINYDNGSCVVDHPRTPPPVPNTPTNCGVPVVQQQNVTFQIRPSVTVKYLSCFLSILYYIGLSPMQPPSAKYLPKWLIWLQTVSCDISIHI